MESFDASVGRPRRDAALEDGELFADLLCSTFFLEGIRVTSLREPRTHLAVPILGRL